MKPGTLAPSNIIGEQDDGILTFMGDPSKALTVFSFGVGSGGVYRSPESDFSFGFGGGVYAGERDCPMKRSFGESKDASRPTELPPDPLRLLGDVYLDLFVTAECRLLMRSSASSPLVGVAAFVSSRGAPESRRSSRPCACRHASPFLQPPPCW